MERGADIGIENIEGNNVMWGANEGLKRHVRLLKNGKDQAPPGRGMLPIPKVKRPLFTSGVSNTTIGQLIAKRPNLTSLGDKRWHSKRMRPSPLDEDDDIRMDFGESSTYLVQNLGSVTPRG
jgi:hypothetical protein